MKGCKIASSHSDGGRGGGGVDMREKREHGKKREVDPNGQGVIEG